MKTHIPPSCRDLTYLSTIQDQPGWGLAKLESAIKEKLSIIATRKGKDAAYYKICGCIAGGEAGVDLADAFSEYLGVLSNGAREYILVASAFEPMLPFSCQSYSPILNKTHFPFYRGSLRQPPRQKGTTRISP